jgi:hypothetical protein
MAGWMWFVVGIAVAGGVLLILWQSAGRQRLDRKDPTLRSANERFETDVNRMRNMRNDGLGGPGGPGGF